MSQVSAQELRIGNLVMVENPTSWPKLKNVPLSVTGIDESEECEGIPNSNYAVRLKDYGLKYPKRYGQFIGFIRPIPITEDWFLKLGLQKSSGENPHFTFGNTIIIFRTEYESECLDNKWQFEFAITKSYGAFREVVIDYVHQLQNLTFDLTGKELIPTKE